LRDSQEKIIAECNEVGIMKVYIIIQDWWYGGIEIEAVFTTMERAEAYLKTCGDDIHRSIMEYDVD